MKTVKVLLSICLVSVTMTMSLTSGATATEQNWDIPGRPIPPTPEAD